MNENINNEEAARGPEASHAAYPPMNFVGGEVIAIDKPLGWTSFDAVKRLRGAIQRRLKMKKFKEIGRAFV